MNTLQVKTGLFAVLVLHVLTASGRADSFPRSDAGEQACQLFAATVLVGAADHGNRQTWLQQCNASKEACLSIKGFIKQNNDGQIPPELTCVGDDRSPPDRRPVPETADDQACDRVAETVLAGVADHGNLPTWIQQCNSSKTACQRARGFILQNNDGQVPPQLTCRQ